MIEREEIIRFVEDRLDFTPTPQTKFWWDTGTAGLDVDQFTYEFAEVFGVDMKVEFFVDYGGSDTSLADGLSRIWKKVTFQPQPSVGHFTIDHLVEVANHKKWFDPKNGPSGS